MPDNTSSPPQPPSTETFKPVEGMTAPGAGSTGYAPIGFSEREALTTPQVVGLSVGAAALVGGLYLALEPPPQAPLPRSVETAIKKLPRASRRQARQAAVAAGTAVADVQQHAVDAAGTLADRIGAARDKLQQQLAGAMTSAGSQLTGSGARLAAQPEARTKHRWSLRQEPDTAVERGRKKLTKAMRIASKRAAESPEQALARIGTVIDDASGRVAGLTKALGEAGRRKEATVRGTLGESLDSLSSGTRKYTKHGRRRIERQLEALEKQRRALAKRTKQGASHLRDRGRDLATMVPGVEQSPSGSPLQTASHAIDRAVSTAVSSVAPLLTHGHDTELGSRLREGAAHTVEIATQRATELGQRVRDDLAPLAKDAVQQVGHRAGELVMTGIATGRAKATELGNAELAGRASQVASRAGEQVGHLAERADSLASRAGRASHDAAGEARRAARRSARAAGATGAAVRSASGQALTTTGGAIKNLTLSLTWAGALGAVVYFGFLSEEQREKVASTARSLYEQARELVRDFQGYDEEF